MRNSTDRDVVERDLEIRRESQIARDNANAAGSFALGIALISLVGVVIAMFVFDQGNEPTAPAQQQQPPDVNITVPSPVAPEAPIVPDAPDINIQVPESQAPVAPQPVAPEPEAVAPAPEALPAQPPQ
ncbi:hypothetical protein H6G89_24095 [Oscillatoria sp. FACHB-1407]|uniref:hypothetical protein n=1 Tax=Oscillatoria sp. FACHB-1407 TaxID=2692847 RepID=UPI001682B067|nr:hypothetical protein [Oscillatoria sp. FACHB-1407]MBD2464088.1 hypothetical protein [Oscillatoria sp. FACHB-1407]